MKAKAQVISERADSYVGKRGKVNQKILALLDLDQENPFINTFDYVLGEDESEKLSGGLQGKHIELAITNFEPAFGGRLRARGRVLQMLGA